MEVSIRRDGRENLVSSQSSLCYINQKLTAGAVLKRCSSTHIQVVAIISFHLSDFVIMLTPKHTCWLWLA